jgi:F1F0 ATPase subunit 2
MKMNEILYVVLAFAVGIMLGALFFGGLWFTVKKAVGAKIPALWFFGSLLVRASITLIGFYVISLGSWQMLLVCLLGFIAARYIIMLIMRPKKEQQLQINKEISHES